MSSYERILAISTEDTLAHGDKSNHTLGSGADLSKPLPIPPTRMFVFALSRHMVIWSVLDLKMAALALVVAIALSVLVLAVYLRGKRWYVYPLVGFCLTCAFFVLVLLVVQLVLPSPVIHIRASFPLP